jgi:DNA-binding PadR family transcriptional regulator
MSVVKSALRRIWSWLSPSRDAQRAPTAIRKALLRPGTRERAVLHAIRVLHDNAYGVAIQEKLDGAKINISFGEINGALGWLEENGYIQSHWSDSTRRKKMFALTQDGEEAIRG